MLKRALFLFSVFFTFALCSKSQDSLSLQDAIQIGMANNFDIQIQENLIRIAENNNTYGETAVWPTIFANALINNGINILDNPGGFLRTGKNQSHNIAPGLQMNWTLFNGMNAHIDKERLEYLETQTAGNARLVIENTAQAIVLGFYQLLLAKERLKVLEDVKALSRDRYNYALIRQELGNAVTFDVLQQKTAFLSDSSFYINQLLLYKNAKRNLNQLLARDISTDFVPKGTLDIEIPEYDVNLLMENMMRDNAQLQVQFTNQELQRNAIRATRTNYQPRIDLNAGFNFNYNYQKLSDLDDPNGIFPTDWTKAKPQNYYANFSLNWVLFDGLKVRRAVENARINEYISNLEVEQLKLALINDLFTAYDVHETRRDLLDISEENVKTAGLNLFLGEEKFRNGAISSIEYRVIQVDYLNIAADNLQAKFDLIDANTELLRLAGGILNVIE